MPPPSCFLGRKWRHEAHLRNGRARGDVDLQWCCGLLSLTEGTDYPIALLGTLLGTTSLTSIDLGTWVLNSGHSHIDASSNEVIALGGAAPPPGPGLPSQWYHFGSVPEPGSSLLALMGLAGIALRSRKA